MNIATLKNGETLAYHKIGHGPNTMVMIHGNLCSSEHFLDFAARLTNDFTIYLPDLRGFGNSSYEHPIASIPDFTQDLDSFVHCLHLNTFTLLGWSAGGCICMDYAAKYPEKVLALVLIETVGICGCRLLREDQKPFASIQEISEEPTQVKPALQALKKQDIAFIKNLWDHAIYIHNKPTDERATALARASVKQRNLAEFYWALSRFNLSRASNQYCVGNGLAYQIQAPTLLTYGEHDEIVCKNDIETLASILSNAELFILKDCGHSPFMDCPEFLAAAIVRWLDTITDNQ